MYSVTYELLTANGFITRHTIKTDSLDKAEEICEAIEQYGYKLVDVTNEPIDEIDE